MQNIDYDIANIDELQKVFDWLKKPLKTREVGPLNLEKKSPFNFYSSLLNSNKNSTPHRSILKIAIERFKAKSVLIEKNYLNSLFIRNYNHAYATSFRDIPRTCIRIHF